MANTLTVNTNSASTKFGRTYLLTVEGKSGTLINISFPTTIQFHIAHNILASANVADISIYGLSANHRNEISFNQFFKKKPYKVTLRAGYISQQPNQNLTPESLPIVFNGYANVAYTEREGPELVTRINALDNGDICNDKPPSCFDPLKPYVAKIGTSYVDMFYAIANKLAHVVPGHVIISPSKIPPPVSGKDRTFNGNVYAALQTLANDIHGAHVFIENGVVNILGQNSTIPGSNNLGVISASSGLLGIPRYTGATIDLRMIFEPSLRIGAKVQLASQYLQLGNTYAPSTNTYTLSSDSLCKIVSYTHSGTISGVDSGDLTSEVSLLQLSTPLGAID